MARLTKVSESPAPGLYDDIYDASPEPSGLRRTANPTSLSMSPSPAASTSSDKENRSVRPNDDKGKGRAPMGPPRMPSPSAGKRKRVMEDRDISVDRNRRRRAVEVDQNGSDSDDYDPEQDVEERRRLRRGLRDLTKNLNENRAEWILPSSTGLRDTLVQANDYSGRIKQTSDATIDSRLLTIAADLSWKKTVALTTGDNAETIDIDDFISKLKSYMRKGGDVPVGSDQARTNTQRRRRRASDDNSSEDDGDDGEMLNWEYLGRNACLPNNSRPSVPGFLLGPLSLQKRARKATVRKAALRPNTLQETRPEVLEAGDIEKSDNKNLTTLCTQILGRLGKVQRDAVAAVEARHTDDMPEKEIGALFDRFGVSRSGGISLFKFVINPHSFGQTVENIFYVSFLIRDGKLGISNDDNGLPFLELTQPRGRDDMEVHGPSKHQAVLAIDMDSWEELIDIFDIKEPMIKHREEEDNRNVGVRGWYG